MVTLELESGIYFMIFWCKPHSQEANREHEKQQELLALV